MNKLKDWFQEQFDEHLVEPNSGLGQVITYMQNHWDKLTLFLRTAGAPLILLDSLGWAADSPKRTVPPGTHHWRS